MKDDESVERLIREAGARPALPEEDLASIRDAVRGEWRQRYEPRRAPNRRAWWMAVAAAVALAAVSLVWRTRTTDRSPAAGPAPVVASVERASEGARWPIGSPLGAGSPVETAADGKERVALRMAGGASVRLDAGTRARLASATLVELERGAVYVDTGTDAGPAVEVAVRAPAGLFQPAGTQFEVRLVEGGVTRLKVREGSVALDRGGESMRTATGEELTVRGDGSLARRSISTFGPEWDWVLDTASAPDIEGMKVRRFLDWAAREAGWRVELADAEAAALADSVDLHGSIQHLTPVDAIGVVLSSAGLEHRLSNGTLVISVSKKGRT